MVLGMREAISGFRGIEKTTVVTQIQKGVKREWMEGRRKTFPSTVNHIGLPRAQWSEHSPP